MNTVYDALAAQLKGLFLGERNKIANLANAAAAIFHALSDVNWAGFYLAENRELVLGCFQGNVACIRILFGRGVCGTAAETNTTQLVADVSEFKGHIACDARSRSEIVVPLHNSSGEVVGVLDIDSAKLARFTEEDKTGLESIAKIIESAIDW